MPVTHTTQDLQAFAARIRPYFQSPLQDIAEKLALSIARAAGARTKELRPDTSLETRLGWVGTDSLRQVDFTMGIEVELGFDLPHENAERIDVTTFQELVTRIASQRGVI